MNKIKLHLAASYHSVVEWLGYVSVKWKLQHAPPGHTPGIWHLCRPGEEGIWLSESSRGWGIWTAPSISCEISGVANYHGGHGVRGFSWKRLCLCGQLVTRKGLKQALCRIWRYLNFKIFNIGFRLGIYECVKLCLQWHTITIPAIQYNNKKSSTEANYFHLPRVC